MTVGSPRLRKATMVVLPAAVASLVLAGCSPDEGPTDAANSNTTTRDSATRVPINVVLHGAAGEELGTALLAPVDGTGDSAIKVTVTITKGGADLKPGFHGLHLHEKPVCDAANGFRGAGEHIRVDAGDLPQLLVAKDGTAELTAVTDRITFDDLLVDGGRALIIHDGPESGDRKACGVVTSAESVKPKEGAEPHPSAATSTTTSGATTSGAATTVRPSSSTAQPEQ